ncbi:MAG: hypothetical protein B7X40_00095 [Cellulomonas sp. 14-74-6]|nr:MAG: hypothetical protein B7X40_00095 [Cellulomonas sp. 14-74-6]
MVPRATDIRPTASRCRRRCVCIPKLGVSAENRAAAGLAAGDAVQLAVESAKRPETRARRVGSVVAR